MNKNILIVFLLLLFPISSLGLRYGKLFHTLHSRVYYPNHNGPIELCVSFPEESAECDGLMVGIFTLKSEFIPEFRERLIRVKDRCEKWIQTIKEDDVEIVSERDMKMSLTGLTYVGNPVILYAKFSYKDNKPLIKFDGSYKNIGYPWEGPYKILFNFQFTSIEELEEMLTYVQEIDQNPDALEMIEKVKRQWSLENSLDSIM